MREGFCEPRRVAVVTGANQGLGFALVDGLCRALPTEDAVYLTARDEGRGAEAVATLRARGLTPRFARLDVSDRQSIERFATMLKAEHGGVDIVISNAVRLVREVPFAEQVRPFVDTSNLATTRLLEQLGPALRDDGRFLCRECLGSAQVPAGAAACPVRPGQLAACDRRRDACLRRRGRAGSRGGGGLARVHQHPL
jgi:NAD(P)-dependent dehydrogenase (short-subunit alcohol dehydrogenase family)